MFKNKSLLFSLIIAGGLLVFNGAEAATLKVGPDMNSCEGTCDYYGETAIQQAVNAANSANNFIEVYGGVWNSMDSNSATNYYDAIVSIKDKDGTSGNPYRLKCKEGYACKIELPGASSKSFGSIGIAVYGSTYWIVDGFTIINNVRLSESYGVLLASGSNYSKVQNCEIYSTLNIGDSYYQSGIYTSVPYTEIIGNTVHDLGNCIGVDGGGTSDGTETRPPGTRLGQIVDGNVMYRCDYVFSATRTNKVVVRNNYLHSAIPDGIRNYKIVTKFRDATDTKVYNNIIECDGDISKCFELHNHTYGYPKNMEVYNNTFLNDGDNETALYQVNSGPMTGGKFKNNIFVGFREGIAMGAYVSGYPYEISHNAFDDCDVTVKSGCDICWNSVYDKSGIQLFASGNKPNPYFSLNSSASAIDAGTSDGLIVPMNDYLGNPRTGTIDIGAFEYVSGEIDTIVPVAPQGLSVW